MQDSSRLDVAPTVQEGGAITVRVGKGVDQVHFCIPGRSSVAVRVVQGVAEYQLPPDATGGTLVVVTDGKLPDPDSKTVTVVGSETS